MLVRDPAAGHARDPAAGLSLARTRARYEYASCASPVRRDARAGPGCGLHHLIADAYATLADVLRINGREADAIAAADNASRLYTSKGNIAAAELPRGIQGSKPIT